MNLENTITNSYSEEHGQFDPPPKQRDDEKRTNSTGYDDALLLASLSDDVEDHRGDNATNEKEASAAEAASSNDNSTHQAATPRRSNATAAPSKESFTLYPKHSSQPPLENTPEQNQQGVVAKKVTPEREVKQQQQQQRDSSENARYTGPHGRYPAYPTPYYGYHQPYYSHPPPHPRYNPPPPPANSAPPPSTQPPNSSDNRESHSPLPYHPLSAAPRYEDHHPPANWGSSWEQHQHHPHPSSRPAPPTWGGYYPYPGGYPPHPAYPPPHPYSNSSPGSAPPPSSSSTRPPPPTSNQSSSPARSVKPWVSMDENSPRVDYAAPGSYPPRSYDYPATPSGSSQPPPGTPSHNHPPSHHPIPPTPSHYSYYEWGQGPTREYASTPPPGYEPWAPDASHPPPYPPHPHSAHHPAAHSPHSGEEEEEKTTHQFRKGSRGVHSEPVILRKKFSWRNYPELEEYLIANRTEYLHHSALNYTAEQKHFNNRLTEGLLELAAKHNYIFDESCFNFVAVRDRIRCYYKSYVQSSKKRGVIVGFPKVKRVKREEEGATDEV